MTWTLNGAPAPRDDGSGWLLIDDVQYPPNWPQADLEALGLVWIDPPTVPLSLDQLCATIDAERDRRLATDFVFDFGATMAVDDDGTEIAAGERALQMRPLDVSNWLALSSVATVAVMSGNGAAVLPMRAEDNWSIQTPATQVLDALTAAFARGSALTMAGGAIKSQQRAAYPEVIDITTGWP